VDDSDSTLACWRTCQQELSTQFESFRFAFVAQTGCTPGEIPIGAQALFLAGEDAWREGLAGRDLIRCAKEEHGIPVHVGRVNSLQRLLHFGLQGVESMDGTYLAFRGRDRGLKEISGWLRTLETYQLMQLPLPQAGCPGVQVLG